MKLEFSWQILKKIPKYKKWTIYRAGPEMFHAGRRTDGQDITKLIVPLHNFANAPNSRCTSEFKYQYKIYTIINDICR
jgi:hypothetical protein